MLRSIVGVAGGRGASAGLNLLLSLILINLLSKEDFGVYYFYYSLIATAALLPNVAVNNGFVLHYQHSEARPALITAYYTLKFSVFLIVVLATAGLWGLGAISDLAALSVASGLMLAFFDTTLNVSQAQQRFAKFSALQPLRNLAILAALAGIYAAFKPLNVDEVIWAFLAGSAVLAVFSVFDLSRRNFTGISGHSIRDLLIGSQRFFVFEISALILARIEVWILQYFAREGVLTSADIAEYGAGLTLAFVFPIISSSVVAVLVTKVVPGKTIGRRGINKLLAASAIALVLALVYALATYKLSKFVIFDEFTQLYWIIPSIVIGMWMSFCTNFARVSLLSGNADRYANSVYIAQTIGGVTVSLLLTGSLGLPGAILGFLAVRLFALVLIGARFIKENV